MKRLLSFISIILFMIVLIAPTYLWREVEKNPKKYEVFTKEIGENRALKEMSEDVTIKDYSKEYEEYYSDRAPFRNYLISFNQKINAGLEIPYKNAIQPALLKVFYGAGKNESKMEVYLPKEEKAPEKEEEKKEEVSENKPSEVKPTEKERKEPTCKEEGYVIYVNEETGEETKEVLPQIDHEFELVEEIPASYTSYGKKIYECKTCHKRKFEDFEAKLVDESYFPAINHEGMVIEGRNNWLFFTGDNTLGYYLGTNLYDEQALQQKAELMQRLKDLCKQKGKEVVFLVAPNKEEIYSEYMPSYDNVPEFTRNDYLSEYMKNHSSAKFLFPKEELKKAKMYYDTYYAYDTHWNNIGAFVATMQIYEKLGMETTDLESIPVSKSVDAAAGLFGTGSINSAGYPDDYEYYIDYKPEIEILSEQGTFDIRGGYDNYQKNESSSENYSKIVMLGDSFRIGMIPIIRKDFKESVFVQRQDAELAKEDIKSANVIVIETVERFDSQMDAAINKVISYLEE